MKILCYVLGHSWNKWLELHTWFIVPHPAADCARCHTEFRATKHYDSLTRTIEGYSYDKR